MFLSVCHRHQCMVHISVCYDSGEWLLCEIWCIENETTTEDHYISVINLCAARDHRKAFPLTSLNAVIVLSSKFLVIMSCYLCHRIDTPISE